MSCLLIQGDRVLIVFEEKDNFDNENEKEKVFISRWAREKQGRHIFICEKLFRGRISIICLEVLGVTVCLVL